VIFNVSEPTIRLREYIFKKDTFISRLFNCAMCSTWHLYFWYYLIALGQFDIIGASISAIMAEFIVRKLNAGSI
jgi:hypothetical protein